MSGCDDHFANRRLVVEPKTAGANDFVGHFDNEAETLFTPHSSSAVDAVRRQIELRACNIVQALRGEAPSDAVNMG